MTTPNQCQFWDCDEIIRRNYFLCADHYRGYDLGAIDQCPPCGKYKQVEYDLCLNCHRQAQAAGAGASARPAAPPPGNAQDGALLAELHSLRRAIAQRNGLPDFMVFSNATLEQMAAMRPTTSDELLRVSGVGPAKLEQYGQDFLRALGKRSGASTGPGNRQPSPPPPPRQNAVQRDNREFPTDKDADRFFVYILLLDGPDGGEYYIGQTRELHERLREHRNNRSQSTRDRRPKLQWFTTVATRREATELEAELQRMNENRVGQREITRWIVDFEKLVDELDHKPHEPIISERPVSYGGVRPPQSRRGR